MFNTKSMLSSLVSSDLWEVFGLEKMLNKNISTVEIYGDNLIISIYHQT